MGKYLSLVVKYLYCNHIVTLACRLKNPSYIQVAYIVPLQNVEEIPLNNSSNQQEVLTEAVTQLDQTKIPQKRGRRPKFLTETLTEPFEPTEPTKPRRSKRVGMKIKIVNSIDKVKLTEDSDYSEDSKTL